MTRRYDGARTPADALFVNLPSKPGWDVLRNYGGAFGIALPSPRTDIGHGPVRQPSSILVNGFFAATAAGLPVTFLDAQAERLPLEPLRARVAAARPRAIVSVVSLPSLENDLAMLATLKEATGARVAVAGTVCRAEETLEAVLAGGIVDVAVTGDLDLVAPAVVEALLSGRTEDVQGTATRDGAGVRRCEGGRYTSMEAFPLPMFDLLPMESYVSWEFGRRRHVGGKQFGPLERVYPLFISRGCPYACAYCPYPLGVGKRWLHKSAAQFVEEVRRVERAGTRHIILQDQTLSEDLDLLAEVCETLLRERVDVEWLCEARVGSLSAEMLALMRRAGCVRVHYGVETGDAELFASEAKRGLGGVSVDDCLRQTEAAGIRPSLHFLVGFAADSWRTVSATLDLVERCHVTSGDCAIMTPYPGTRFHDEMQASGKLFARSWADYTGTDAIVATDHLSPVELSIARSRILEAIRAQQPLSARRRLRDARRALLATRQSEPLASLVEAPVARLLRPAGSVSAGSSRGGAAR